jgi:hypothetical protein
VHGVEEGVHFQELQNVWLLLVCSLKPDKRLVVAESSIRKAGNGRIVGISGQSLPILAPLPTIDVLWSDLHMVHEDRSLMSYESFYWTFRTARTQKILAGSGDPSS